MAALNIVLGMKEQKLKRKYNINIGDEDFVFTKKNIILLVLVGVIGGMIAGGLGIGGGVILNP